MTVIDYELPTVERLISTAIAPPLVGENYGADRMAPYEKFNKWTEGPNGEPVVEPTEATDWLVFTGRGGYVIDQHSKDTIAGLDVECWAKSRARAEWLSNQVIKAMYDIEMTTIDGFSIDFVESLTRPEEDKYAPITDDRMFMVSFEIHIGAKWIRE